MKYMCHCGQQINHEPPFDDFRTIRVPCGRYCRKENAQTPQPEKLADAFRQTPFPVKRVGMLGH